MPITIEVTAAEAALMLRLLEAELTAPHPRGDLQRYREVLQGLVDRFHAVV